MFFSFLDEYKLHLLDHAGGFTLGEVSLHQYGTGSGRRFVLNIALRASALSKMGEQTKQPQQEPDSQTGLICTGVAFITHTHNFWRQGSVWTGAVETPVNHHLCVAVEE